MIIKCPKCNKERRYKPSIAKRLKSSYCRKCSYMVFIPWNKGTKGLVKQNSGSFKKGQISWNKGLTKRTDERLKKYGQKISRIHKESFANGRIPWNKGKPWSEEVKKKISKANKGHTPWCKGKKCPQLAGKNNYFYGKRFVGNKSPVWKGGKIKRHCFECNKIFETYDYLKKYGTGKYCSTDCRMIGAAKVSPTSIEKKLYNELKARGLLFEKQRLINGKFLVDAYIPSLNLIIEADGDYWHSLPKVVRKDKSENAYLTKCGYNLLRLPEHEINDGSFKEKLPS